MTQESSAGSAAPLPTLTKRMQEQMQKFLNSHSSTSDQISAIRALILLKAEAYKKSDKQAIDFLKQELEKQENANLKSALNTTVQFITKMITPTATFSPVHPKINRKDLQANGKFLTEPQIKAVNEYFEKNPTKNMLRKTDYENIQCVPPLPKFGYLMKVEDEQGQSRIVMAYKGAKKKKALGKGAFGVAKIAQDLESGEFLALKVQDVGTKNPEMYIQEEYAILEEVGQAKGYLKREVTNAKNEPKNQRLILMPLAQGISLDKFIAMNKNMPAERYLQLCNNILQAYKEQVQDKNLIHRDLKPQNMIVDPLTLKVTIIDFGFALSLEDNETEVESAYAGTWAYTSVDMLQKKAEHQAILYSEKTEVFALGKTIGQVLKVIKEQKEITPKLIRETPNYDGKDYLQLQPAHLTHASPIKEETMRNQVISVLAKMTHRDEKQRLSLADSQALFQTAQEAYLSTPANLKKVALFDIQEYEKLDKDQQKYIRAGLKVADEVYMINVPADYAPTKFDVLKRQLTRVGIPLSNTYYKATPTTEKLESKQLEDIQLHLLAQSPSQIKNCYFVSATQAENMQATVPVIKVDEKSLDSKYATQLIQRLENVTVVEISTLTKLLTAEAIANQQKSQLLTTSSEKNANKYTIRQRVIEETLQQLTNKNQESGLTVADVNQALQQLQQTLFSGNALVRLFQQKTGLGVSSNVKEIHKFHQQILKPSPTVNPKN